MEVLDKNCYIDYYSISRDQPEIELFENKYYNEEIPEHQAQQNVLAFAVRPQITENEDHYLLTKKFKIEHRIRQISHQPRDLAEVRLPLLARFYTNAIKPEVVSKFEFDDGCIFQFWQEAYIGSLHRFDKSFETIDIIVPNTEFKELAELSTTVSVLVALALTVVVILTAPGVSEIEKKKEE